MRENVKEISMISKTNIFLMPFLGEVKYWTGFYLKFMFSHEFGQVHFLEQFLFLIKDHNEKIYTYAEKKKNQTTKQSILPSHISIKERNKKLKVVLP